MLDVAIGLALVFAIFAGLVSGLNEMVAQLLSWRGKVLLEGIQGLLATPSTRGWVSEFVRPPQRTTPETDSPVSSDHDRTAELFANPLIATLAQPGTLPSYVPPPTFAAALVQTLAEGGSLTALRHTLEDRKKPLGALFGPMLDEANGDIEAFKVRVADHFSVAMDRVEGWYKRRTQVTMGVLALLAAILLNVDAVHILRNLESNETLRSRLVETAYETNRAARAVERTPTVDATVAKDVKDQAEALKASVSELKALDVPIGWDLDQGRPRLLDKQDLPLLGWLLTALAGMLGAPFWFDAISKLIDIRGTGRKPERATVPPSVSRTTVVTPAGGGPPVVAIPAAPVSSEVLPNDFEASRLTSQDIEELQRALGFPEARIDGVLSEPLRAALREWQRVKKRPADGRFDESTVLELLYG